MPSDRCSGSHWTGAALTIAGGYIWEDVYDVAFPRNLTVVGGGDPVCLTPSPLVHEINVAHSRASAASADIHKVGDTHQLVTTMALQQTKYWKPKLFLQMEPL